jgi:hypothetical protein
VLQSQSATVTLYLTHAAKARERAQQTALKSERTFYDRMEQRWLTLAASTALVERVDLFIHTLQSSALPHDQCARCHGIMPIETIEVTSHQEIYTLRCRTCGDAERRTVARYASSAGASRGTGTVTAAEPQHPQEQHPQKMAQDPATREG